MRVGDRVPNGFVGPETQKKWIKTTNNKKAGKEGKTRDGVYWWEIWVRKVCSPRETQASHLSLNCMSALIRVRRAIPAKSSAETSLRAEVEEEELPFPRETEMRRNMRRRWGWCWSLLWKWSFCFIREKRVEPPSLLVDSVPGNSLELPWPILLPSFSVFLVSGSVRSVSLGFLM